MRSHLEKFLKNKKMAKRKEKPLKEEFILLMQMRCAVTTVKNCFTVAVQIVHK